MSKWLLISLFVLAECGDGSALNVKAQAAVRRKSIASVAPLSQINLTEIRAIAPKGRVQDRDYNQLYVAESLIAHGKESIPYLISKLNDATKIRRLLTALDVPLTLRLPS